MPKSRTGMENDKEHIRCSLLTTHMFGQVVPCSQCRYQYELASGTVTEAESEAIRWAPVSGSGYASYRLSL